MDIKSLDGKSAFDLFPDMFPDVPEEKKTRKVVPPPPPDTSWLEEGIVEKDTIHSVDSFTALVVIIAENARTIVERVLVKMGYAIDTAVSAEQAIQRLQANQYDLIICGTEAALKDIHQYICSFPSTRRRMTYYAIIGPHLHTLYNLEALAFSVNLVIGEQDLQDMENILRKGFHDYEGLFRPLLESIGVKTSLV